MRLTGPEYERREQAVLAADGIIASGMTVEKLHLRNRPDAVDVPNAVDTGRFAPHLSDVRAHLGVGRDALLLLYVARFQAFKNHPLVLRAFARCVAEYPRRASGFGGQRSA